MARILLVTPDDALARMTLWILAEQHHEAQSASDAMKAIDVFQEFRPDIVLFDGRLSPEKRLQAERMYQELPSVQIIGLHDHAHNPGQRHIRADGHLHKPFHAEDLIGLVNQLLACA